MIMKSRSQTQKPLHPRNRHHGRYDFESLKKAYPELQEFVAKNKYGDDSIDFTEPKAVKALNRALLKKFYGVEFWDIPENFLCPPIPGRADYLHYMGDLLAEAHAGKVPEGKEIRVLDIGVGANCIYPLIGHAQYGWNFLGVDINPLAIDSAQSILKQNPKFESEIELRLQPNPEKILQGALKVDETFSFSMCNPPFHGSLEEAQASTRRKWDNLGKRQTPKHEKQHTNFGGQGAELWCEGGELRFILQMIQESVAVQKQSLWFSSLVSREETLPAIYAELRRVKAKNFRTMDMAQGQKKSRVVAWTFFERSKSL